MDMYAPVPERRSAPSLIGCQPASPSLLGISIARGGGLGERGKEHAFVTYSVRESKLA